ncbi:MAG: DUF4407 domain-containing protein [Chitinophagaceae bacterium]
MALKDNIFIWLSGADPEALQNSTEAEKRKFIKLGLTILVPAVMSWVGMWFASPYIGIDGSMRIIAATIWSLLVLIIDTYLISSLNKRTNITQKKTFNGLAGLRILLAIFIGIVISHPIVLRILEANINEEIHAMKREKILELVSENRDSATMWSQSLTIDRALNDSTISCLERLLKGEANGIKLNAPCGTTSGIKNRGFRYNQLSNEISEKKLTRDSFNSALTQIQDKFEDRTRIDTLNLSRAFSADYLKRMQALQRLKNNKSTSWSTNLLTIFLFLFFVLLDSIAIISKVIASPGDYESNYNIIVALKHTVTNRKLATQADLETQTYEKDKQYRDALISGIYQRGYNLTLSQIQNVVGGILNGFGKYTGINASNLNSIPKQYKPLRLVTFLVASLLCGLLLWYSLKQFKIANDDIAVAMSLYTALISVISPTLIK